MPAFLDSRDRRLVIGAFVAMLLLLALTYVLRPVPVGEAGGSPSSDSADWAGAKGAFLLLQRLGYRAERWQAPPEELPADGAGTTLILAEPFESFTGEDRAAVVRFVAAGGRLLAAGASAAQFAPGAAAVGVPDLNPTPKTYSARIASPISRDAPEITMVAPDRWTASSALSDAVYGDAADPVVVWYRVGKGQVIWWASPSPLSNGSIRDKGNLTLFLNSVGPSSSRILWDEYFHGARQSIGSYFAETPLPWAGLQVAIAFAALLFTFSRRSQPARAPLSESRLSPLEFVETLGDLYQSAHAAGASVSVVYERLRLLLSRKLGVPAKTKLPQLCQAAAARFGWPEAPLFGILSRSESAMREIDLDEHEALELVRDLHAYAERLEPCSKHAEEKPLWR